MKQYLDLTPNERVLFDKIESIFINHPSVSTKSFVTVLGVLINKHKVTKK